VLTILAAEKNQTETAFVVPVADGTYCLRWCTPVYEVRGVLSMRACRCCASARAQV
jgi:hypothetical protein